MSAATKAAERDALERLQRDVRKHARDESVEIDAARGSGDILQRVLRPRRHAVSKRQRSLRARPTDSRDEA
jgi:hypothetical protein